MKKTIVDVLADLPPHDGRRDSWERLDYWVRRGLYPLIFAELSNHAHDYDFGTQVIIIGNSINEYGATSPEPQPRRKAA